MKAQWTYLCMLIVAAMLSGCGGAAINKNQYVLDISLPHAAEVSQPPSTILEIRNFAIDSEFSSRQIVYRMDEFKYVLDYYNEFFIPPAMMITQAARNWLADAGLFARVLEPGSAMTPAYVLDGSIVACYADARNKTAPVAVLKMRVFFSKRISGTDTIVWSRTYEMSEPMKNARAESFIASMSRCVQSILQKLETDLSRQPI